MESNEKLQFVIDENGYKHFLIEEIGRGGQGIVWKTKDPNIIVKIKINSSTGEPVVDEEKYDEFKSDLDEVRILDLPEFIHIAKPVTLLKRPYCGYVMRLLENMKPIKYWIRPFDETTNPIMFYYKTGGLRHRLELLTNTAEIFTKLFCHSAVYADLSPNNIFVSGTNDASEVWLIDADNMRYRYDVEKEIMTPGYGAPEVVLGGVNTLDSDEYSFAILAHEILTLNSPFMGELLTDNDDGGWDSEEDNSTLAEEGKIPWIEDPEDDSNRCHTGIPGKIVFTDTIRSLFEKTFSEEGRQNPTSRPKMREWYTALKQAQDYTIQCKYCKSTYLMTRADSKCPFCKSGKTEERGKVIFAQMVDYYDVDEIINNVNQELKDFNEDGEFEVEKISKSDVKTSAQAGVKLFDMFDGKYHLYNYHTDDVSFSEENTKTIELDIDDGCVTIRNISEKAIEMSSDTKKYGFINPNESKRLDSINNITLKTPINSIRTRYIRFYVI